MEQLAYIIMTTSDVLAQIQHQDISNYHANLTMITV